MTIKMTGETPEVRSDKRRREEREGSKEREEREERAASRYGWRETKLRLALHLDLLSEEEEEEDFDVDNNNDLRGVQYLCSTLTKTASETRVSLRALCLETRPLLKSKTHSATLVFLHSVSRSALFRTRRMFSASASSNFPN